jgi:hypothetical protein
MEVVPDFAEASGRFQGRIRMVESGQGNAVGHAKALKRHQIRLHGVVRRQWVNRDTVSSRSLHIA